MNEEFVKRTKSRDLRKGVTLRGILYDDGEIIVHCTTLYTRTRSMVGRKQKVCPGRDCNDLEAEINDASGTLKMHSDSS